SQLPMFSRIGAAAYKPGLDTSVALDNYFGNPHKKFKSIHVGGTNGKGSCSHTIAAILQSQGYKVALYTSPHLVDFRERIRVNGEMIPKDAVVKFVEEWKKCDYDGHPSFFELTMIMAFKWFAEMEVDYAVIEVGMGGRLDSTNIISPIASLITNISFDHTQFLGDTLPAIAREKAGIIKKGIPVVIGEAVDKDVRNVFAEKAAEVKAPIIFAEEVKPLLSAAEVAEGGWDCNGQFISPLNPELPVSFFSELAGDYQKKNINTILCMVNLLRSIGICLDESSVINGFAHVSELTGFAGRWMRMAENPLIICDTGHNKAGIAYNMEQLQRLLSRRSEKARLKMVIGFVSDKDVEHILNLLPTERVDYFITQASVPRAMPKEELASRFKESGRDGKLCDDVKSAAETAIASANEEDIIYIGGSTFIVADYLS
ncbi:MAG: bifunctional folylpolyglutamate synthase/dihydrofolate synthase, partial [Muribaculaceae bacterium]|nr:bifunctional folylpolyglutamate synthase/dihydrofolate synthase [Muribaculaceae bacterium]